MQTEIKDSINSTLFLSLQKRLFVSVRLYCLYKRYKRTDICRCPVYCFGWSVNVYWVLWRSVYFITCCVFFQLIIIYFYNTHVHLKTHIYVSMYVVCLYIVYQKYSKKDTGIEFVRKWQVFLFQVLYYTSRGSNDKYMPELFFKLECGCKTLSISLFLCILAI